MPPALDHKFHLPPAPAPLTAAAPTCRLMLFLVASFRSSKIVMPDPTRMVDFTGSTARTLFSFVCRMPTSVAAAVLPVTLGCEALREPARPMGHTKLAVLWKWGRETRSVTGVPACAVAYSLVMMSETSWVVTGVSWTPGEHERDW